MVHAYLPKTNLVVALLHDPTVPLDTSTAVDANDEEDSEVELDEAMEGTEELLDELIRLGVAIRRAGASSHLRNADRFFDPDNYAALRDHLIQVILGRPSEIESRRRLGDGKLTYRFTEDDLSPMQKCLITANLKRRNRFVYARSHGTKLAAQRTKTRTNASGASKRPVELGKLEGAASPGPEGQAAGSNTQFVGHSDAQGDQRSSFTTSAHSLGTQHSAFSRALDLNTPEPTPSKKAVSQISSTASKVVYPRKPPKAARLQSFVCPCCWRTLSSKMTNKEWK